MDLTKILKPGMKLFTPIAGEVTVQRINKNKAFPIECIKPDNTILTFTLDGKYTYESEAECLLFPSGSNRDWSNVTELMLAPPKKGDYLISRDIHDSFDRDRVFIYNGNYNIVTGHYGCMAGIDYANNLCVLEGNNWTRFAYRYATEEEIKEFNKRLYEERGYIFNKEGRKLEFQGRVKRGGTYYYIHYNGKIEQNSDDRLNYDDKMYDLGNYFLTREEAEQCREKIKRVYQECKRWT